MMKHADTIDALNNLLANLHILNVKLHNFHWNISGVEFGMVHNKTEGYYDYFFAQFDDVAERILQLEGKPIATIQGYLTAASIDEDTKTDFSAKYVYESILADFAVLLSQIKAVNIAADADGDVGTADMMGGLIAWIEKECWILRSSLPR